MSSDETRYALESTGFSTFREAQSLADTLEENLRSIGLGSPNVRAELVETFSEIVNNAAEHGMTPEGAHAHVRHMPHRRGTTFDVAVADEGPGIRATLANNPGLDVPGSDAEAILLATQELVSGTGEPTRGIGLWMTVPQMRRPGRKIMMHWGAGLLVMRRDGEPELRETYPRHGVLVRLTIPA